MSDSTNSTESMTKEELQAIVENLKAIVARVPPETLARMANNLPPVERAYRIAWTALLDISDVATFFDESKHVKTIVTQAIHDINDVWLASGCDQ